MSDFRARDCIDVALPQPFVVGVVTDPAVTSPGGVSRAFRSDQLNHEHWRMLGCHLPDWTTDVSLTGHSDWGLEPTVTAQDGDPAQPLIDLQLQIPTSGDNRFIAVYGIEGGGFYTLKHLRNMDTLSGRVWAFDGTEYSGAVGAGGGLGISTFPLVGDDQWQRKDCQIGWRFPLCTFGFIVGNVPYVNFVPVGTHKYSEDRTWIQGYSPAYDPYFVDLTDDPNGTWNRFELGLTRRAGVKVRVLTDVYQEWLDCEGPPYREDNPDCAEKTWEEKNDTILKSWRILYFNEVGELVRVEQEDACQPHGSDRCWPYWVFSPRYCYEGPDFGGFGTVFPYGDRPYEPHRPWMCE